MSIQASWVAVSLVAGSVATPARAQFSNSALGLSFGYAALTGNSLTYALPLTLLGSVHLEDNFDVTASFAVAYVRLPGAHPDGVLLLPALGFRYLFLSETIRPYIGVDLSYIHVLMPSAAWGATT